MRLLEYAQDSSDALRGNHQERSVKVNTQLLRSIEAVQDIGLHRKVQISITRAEAASKIHAICFDLASYAPFKLIGRSFDQGGRSRIDEKTEAQVLRALRSQELLAG